MSKDQKKSSNNDKVLDPITESKISTLTISPYERAHVVNEGLKQLNKLRLKNGGQFSVNPADEAYQLLTLHEFDKGTLITQGVGTPYKAMVIDLSRQFQMEYECKTVSEKATAHLAAQNFVRTMELQKDLSCILNAESYNDFKLRRYQIISKAYDQANHQYFLSIQTLRQLKQPPINVTVKTDIANIAQNQLIQENNEAKPK